MSGILLAAGTVAVVNFSGPSATIQPLSVNGRTWLPITRGTHASLILANGISGLVEAGGENEAVDLPTDLVFAGSSAAATVLQSPAASVVVANDTHREVLLDVPAGSHSLLSGNSIVSFGTKARVHHLGAGTIGPATDIELGTGTVSDNPPVADGQGRVWTLMSTSSGISAVAVSPTTGTAVSTAVTGELGTLIVVDGAVYHVSVAGITPLSGGRALQAPGSSGVVPQLAVATSGVWAVARGTALTIVTGDQQHAIDAPADVTALAVWHGAVWLTAGDVLYRVKDGTFDRVAALHQATRPYVDGGRMWFVGTDAVVSVDDRQNAVIFDLSAVDIALCVQTCSAADAARYIDELPQPKAPTSNAPTEPPSQITLPPVLPTPPPTSALTAPAVTVTPPTSTRPPRAPATVATAGTTATTAPAATVTSPATARAPVTAPAVAVPESAATLPPAVTPPPIQAPPTVDTAQTDPPPAPTDAATLPRPTRPVRPPPQPTTPSTDPLTIPDTVVATNPPDTAPPSTTPPSTTPPSTTPPSTTSAPAPGHVILSFASSDDPIRATTTSIVAGWDGAPASCRGALDGLGVGTLSWSGAGAGSRLVQIDFANPASVSINVAPGTLTVSFTACGETAQITRAVASLQPTIGDVGFAPAKPQAGQVVQAKAVITNAGWRVVGASWLGGSCALGTDPLQSSFTQTSTSATLPTGAAGAYCVSVVVSFTKSGTPSDVNASGQVIVSASTTPSTVPPTTTAVATTVATTAGATTSPTPPTTAPTTTTGAATTTPAATTNPATTTTTTKAPATTTTTTTTVATTTTTKAPPPPTTTTTTPAPVTTV